MNYIRHNFNYIFMAHQTIFLFFNFNNQLLIPLFHCLICEAVYLLLKNKGKKTLIIYILHAYICIN